MVPLASTGMIPITQMPQMAGRVAMAVQAELCLVVLEMVEKAGTGTTMAQAERAGKVQMPRRAQDMQVVTEAMGEMVVLKEETVAWVAMEAMGMAGGMVEMVALAVMVEARLAETAEMLEMAELVEMVAI